MPAMYSSVVAEGISKRVTGREGKRRAEGNKDAHVFERRDEDVAEADDLR